MVNYIVINNSKDKVRPYREVYQVFSDPQKACDHAIACGFNSMFGKPTPSSLKVGTMNSLQSYPYDVSIMAVEVIE